MGNHTLDVHSLAAGVTRSLGSDGAVCMKSEHPVVASATALSSHTLKVTTPQRSRTLLGLTMGMQLAAYSSQPISTARSAITSTTSSTRAISRARKGWPPRPTSNMATSSP